MEHLDPIPNKVLLGSYIQNVSVQTVPQTLLVRYHGSEYSVPAKSIGKRVKIVPTGNELYIYFSTELISIHRIAERKINYHKDDYIGGMRQAMPSDFSDDELIKRSEQNLALFDQWEGMKE